MPLYSNYNVLAVSNEDTHKEGDVFHYSGKNWKFKKFDGLIVESVFYCWHKCLRFDFSSWDKNIPHFEPSKINNKKSFFRF